MHLQTPKTEVIISIEFFNIEFSSHSANLSLELSNLLPQQRRSARNKSVGSNGSPIGLRIVKISRKQFSAFDLVKQPLTVRSADVSDSLRALLLGFFSTGQVNLDLTRPGSILADGLWQTGRADLDWTQPRNRPNLNGLSSSSGSGSVPEPEPVTPLATTARRGSSGNPLLQRRFYTAWWGPAGKTQTVSFLFSISGLRLIGGDSSGGAPPSFPVSNNSGDVRPSSPINPTRSETARIV
ncbi:hypothetical protein AAC387_Pa06g3198 [Persea americana]